MRWFGLILKIDRSLVQASQIAWGVMLDSLTLNVSAVAMPAVCLITNTIRPLSP